MPKHPKKRGVIINITKNLPLKLALEHASDCRQCSNCCIYGSGFMLKEDVKRAAKHVQMDEKGFIQKYCDETTAFNTKVWKPKIIRKKSDMPYGPCIFLKKEKCIINEAKPLHCRLTNCKDEDLHWYFVVNYLVNPNDPQSIRDYAVFIKSGGKVIPGAGLKDLVPQPKKLKAMMEYLELED